MKNFARAVAIPILATAFLAEAASNLNLSKSNYFSLTCSGSLVSPAQAAAILADLDKSPAMDNPALEQVLRGELKKRGKDPARVKKILIRPEQGGKRSIILLESTKPEDERAAIAVSDGAAPAEKPAKKGNAGTK